jgi:hypothetical protein
MGDVLMATPENVRATTYLVARERLDAKRRTTKVKCVAPNRVCGGRCIPPDWDCRLKGEGADPHLTAVGKGSDPVAGLASVERGLSRIGRGVTKLSFSEIEGGRKALARGTAKLSPGDLKRKEEIKKNVDLFLGRVLLPASAIVGAGLLHKGLKNFKGYRSGAGQQVDDAARSAIDLVRTNIPGYGAAVRQRQRAGVAAVGAMGRAAGSIESLGATNLTTNAGQRRSLSTMVGRQSQYEMDPLLFNALDKSLRSVDGKPNKRSAPSQLPYSEWHARSVEAFWNTPRTENMTPAGAKSGGSAFSVHATNTLLANSFGFEPRQGRALKDEGTFVVNRLATYLKTTGADIRSAMREAGLNAKDPTAVASYIGRAGGNTSADALSYRTLVASVISNDHQTQAKSIYARTVNSYDQLFRRVAEDIQQAPAIDIVRNRGNRNEAQSLRNMRQNSFYNDAVEGHSVYLGRQLNLPEPVYGSYTATVARKAYHARFVAGKRRLPNNNSVSLTLTPTEALNAGLEIARAKGLPEPSTSLAALRLVNESYGWPMGEYQRGNALGEVSLVRGSASRPRGVAQEGTPTPERAARRRVRSRSQIVADLVQAGYSPEAAATEANRLIAMRRQDARMDTYGLVREDFTPTPDRKGKPCGKSFVPKQAKCSKPTTARYKEPEPGQNAGTGLVQKVAKVAAVAGAAAGGVIAAKKGKALYKNRRNVEAYSKFAPKAMNAAITRLSQADVRKGLAKVPDRFRPQAEKLVGKAKSAMAYVSADAQGYNLRKVNNKSNFSVWSTDDQSRVMTVGSVGDTLVTFSADRSSSVDLRTESGRGVGVYDMQFNSDLGFQQKKGLDRQSQLGVAKMVKSMNTDVTANMPKNAVLRNIPYGDDGLGAKRRGIYEKAGYKSLPGLRGNAMFATLDNGKVVPIDQQYASFYADLIKGDDYDTAVRKLQTRGRRDSTEQSAPLRILVYAATKERLGLATA